MSAGSLAEWLIGTASRDALLAAWRAAPGQPLAGYETGALAAAARAGKTQTPITIAVPGGRSRLPLLAAVHAAALRLPGFPSPFSGRDRGPVALVTTHVVRRDELAGLDAAGVPVSPALHPARLRADRLVAPLPGGKPRQQDPRQLLLLAGPTARWVIPEIPPTVAVIDAADEPPQFAADAAAWARACGATPVVFADIARRTWLEGSVAYPCGWSQILAACPGGRNGVSALAPVRGHAAVLAAGALPGLPAAAALLAAARRHGPLPPVLIEASVMWRRLGELVVPVATYDAACPRWHTPTLSERLEDLLAIRAEDFPRGWRTWTQTGWAGIKEGLASARAALSVGGAKAALLTEAVDADLRAGLAVDVALPSRTARDALTRHLADAGVPLPADGQLVVRSLADAGAWEPPRATVLAAPPAMLMRHRITGADIGPLSVLCYDHETGPLRRMLCDALDEPAAVGGPVHQLLPPALKVPPVLPAQRPAVVLTAAPAAQDPCRPDGRSLAHLADAADIAGLTALNVPGQESAEDLPEEDDTSPPAATAVGRHGSAGLAVAVPLIVVSSAGGPQAVVHVPADGTAARILGGAVRRIPVRDVLPGMLLAGLDGLTPFDRLRPLLPEARGPVARMLLAAWDQALAAALRQAGGPAPLARALAGGQARISESAVAAWTDEDRIGPRHAANVTRVGELAGHPVVAGHGHAIAVIMRHLRQLHQAIGRLVASPGGPDAEAAEELELLLGPDALSVLAEIVIYRVVAVGAVTTVSKTTLYAASPAAEQPGEPAQQEAENGG
ncbi:MAG TPA: hypothetical protein VFE59_00910 [Trebonia sp.]|nr:hypothetical protein [Trebonia sp.]